MFKSIFQYKKWGLFLVIFFSNVLLFSHETVNLENAWKFRAKDYPIPGNRSIVVFSPYRTGSTLVYNVLRFLFIPKEGDEPIKVMKTHELRPEHLDQFIFITIRNPIDAAYSMCRIKDQDGEPITEEYLNRVVTKLRQKCRQSLEASRNYPRAYVIRYEEEIENIPALIQHIEKILNIQVHDFDKELLNRFFNKEAVLAYIKEKNFQKFSEYDMKTQIHGNHISSNDDLLEREPDLRNVLKKRLAPSASLFEQLGYHLEE